MPDTRIMIYLPTELAKWLYDKARAERREMREQAVWMLEQLMRQEQAAAAQEE